VQLGVLGHAMAGLLALVLLYGFGTADQPLDVSAHWSSPAESFASLGLGVRRASPCSRSSGAGGVHCRNANPAARGSWSVAMEDQG
jgi:hypothetical protein